MPFIDVSLVEGRTPEQLTALVIALTYAAHSAIGAPRDSIRVVLREVPATHWAAGGTTIAERRATSGSSELPTSPDDRTTP